VEHAEILPGSRTVPPPADFSLGDWASREPWELPLHDPVEVTLELDEVASGLRHSRLRSAQASREGPDRPWKVRVQATNVDPLVGLVAGPLGPRPQSSIPLKSGDRPPCDRGPPGPGNTRRSPPDGRVPGFPSIQIQLLTLHLRQGGGPMTSGNWPARPQWSGGSGPPHAEDRRWFAADPSVYEYVEILLDGDMVELGPNTQVRGNWALWSFRRGVPGPGARGGSGRRNRLGAGNHDGRHRNAAAVGAWRDRSPAGRTRPGGVPHWTPWHDEWIAVRDVASSPGLPRPGTGVTGPPAGTGSSRRREVVPLRLRNDGRILGTWRPGASPGRRTGRSRL
jgi:hypothetical protein